MTKSAVARVVVKGKIKADPLVSVIIPVYNTEKYLQECLNSLRRQRLKNIEIICIDDGSTDSSLTILKKYAAKDSRVTVLCQPNLRAGAARNAGLAVARGKYIHFMDSDDTLQPDFYEKMVAAMSDASVDFAVCGFNPLIEDTRWAPTGDLAFEGNLLIAVNNRKRNINSEIWNKLYRKEIIDKYNIIFPPYTFGEDVAFNALYLCFSNIAFFLSDKLYNYRLHPESLIGQVMQKRGAYNNLMDSLRSRKYVMERLDDDVFINNIQFLVALMDRSVDYIFGQLPVGKFFDAFKFIRTELLARFERGHVKNSALLCCIYDNDYRKFLYKLNYKEIKYAKVPMLCSDTGQVTYRGRYWQLKKCANVQRDINVTFILDAKYFACTYVALTSLIHNKSPMSRVTINIIYTDLPRIQKCLLINLAGAGVNVRMFRADTGKYSGIAKVHHITNTALLKFDLPNILGDIDKTLYIDGDVLISADLFDLYNMDLGDNYIGAVRELRAEKQGFHKNTKSEYYINSGVMLMNLAKMRADNLTERLIDKKMHQPEQWVCMDQDVFNNVCNKHVKILPVIYNDVISIFMASNYDIGIINRFYGTKYKSFRQLYNASVIKHFAGNLKPWAPNTLPKYINNEYRQIAKHLVVREKFICNSAVRSHGGIYKFGKHTVDMLRSRLPRARRARMHAKFQMLMGRFDSLERKNAELMAKIAALQSAGNGMDAGEVHAD